MKAAHLLALYERIADAPDAVAQLRRFVLDLAVRGKLVPQNVDDEPASELLKRIGKERGGVQTNQAGTEKSPFSTPASWRWTTLGNLVLGSDAGWSPKTADHPRRQGHWGVLKVSAVSWDRFRPEENKEVLLGTEPKAQATIARGDFLISRANTSELVARAVIVEVDPLMLMMSDKIVRLRLTKHADHRFVWLVNNNADFARQHYSTNASGVSASMKNVSRDVIMSLPFPLPPLAEQHRIVAKVDELMALCDRLEAARTEREATRDRLAAASLARLNTPDPETFPADASFALNTLPALTTRPDQIKALRQTILNLAVRGKLVPQDPNDEPVSEVVGRIAKGWRSHAATTRKGTNWRPEEIGAAETPYPTPPGWVWLRVEDLAQPGQAVTYGILKPEWVEDGVPTVRVSEMKTGDINVASLPRCDPQRAAKFAKTTLMEGDLLVSKDGTIGKTAFVPAELAGGNITQHVLRFSITSAVNRRFIKVVIDGPPYQALLAGETKGVALQGVNVGDFRMMPLPIPPLAEQHRIVAKVDKLMALCDALEASLGAASTSRARLLNALLADALSADATGLMAAAQ